MASMGSAGTGASGGAIGFALAVSASGLEAGAELEIGAPAGLEGDDEPEDETELGVGFTGDAVLAEEFGVAAVAKPRSSEADADGEKKASNMAHAIASFTRDSFLAAYLLARTSLRDEVL